MIIVGSDNKYLFRKFGDRIFDLDPKTHLPVANASGEFESWEDFSENQADLDSTIETLSPDSDFEFETSLTDGISLNDAIRKKFDWHTGLTRDESWLYMSADKLVEVPTFLFNTITDEISITFQTYGGSRYSDVDNWLFHGARKDDGGVVVGAKVTDASGNIEFVTGSQVGDINTTEDLSVSVPNSDDSELITWTFIKNATTGYIRLYKNGVEVVNSSGNTLDIADIERFVIGGTFNSEYWNGRISFFRIDNVELTPEVINHLAYPNNALQSWPEANFNTMALTTLTGGSETGTATVLGTSVGLRLSGEARRALDLNFSPANVGYNTYLEFDFYSSSEGDQHAIAILDSDGSTDWTKAFQIFGSVTTQGDQTYNDYQLSDGYKHYKIPIGQILGNLDNHDIIGFINTGSGNSDFYNVRVVEEVIENTTLIDLSNLDESIYFSAGDITLARWYDASDTSTILHTSGRVYQWNDKSGSNKHATQSTNSDRPSTGTRNINGLNALDFDNAANWMEIPTQSFNPSIPFGIFAVGKQDVNDSGGGIVGYSDKGDKILVDLNDNLFVRASNSGSGNTTTWTRANNNFQLNVIRDSSDVIKSSISGATQVTLGNDDGYSQWSYIGRVDANPPTQCFNGLIAEVIMISGPISTTTRQKIEGYLAHKWGLTGNLPSNHPYKNTRPLKQGVIDTISSNSIIVDQNVDLAYSISYDVTSETRLEFNLRGNVEDDQVIIAVQDNLTGYEAGDHAFKLWGSGVAPPNVNSDYDNYPGGNVHKRYSIPIGSYFTGNQTYLKFVMGSTQTNANLSLSNVELVEPPTIPADDDDSAIITYQLSETGGGKVTDTSGNENHGMIIKGLYDNPYAGRALDFNNLFKASGDYFTNMALQITFDESLNGKFFDKVNNAPIYLLGDATLQERVISPSGHSALFEGTDYLAIDYTMPVINASMSFRFKTTNSGTMCMAATGLGQTITGADRYVELVNGEIQAELNGETIISSGLTLNDGQWHHVVYSYGTTLGGQRLIVDDVIVATGSQTTSLETDHDHVGLGARNAGINDFVGELDDFRIYTEVISEVNAATIRDNFGTDGSYDRGRKLYMEGSSFCTLDLSSTVTISEDTIIEFDFESTEEGEWHGLVFTNDNGKSDFIEAIKLFGTEDVSDDIIDHYDYTLVDGVKHYKIHIGQLITLDTYQYLSFITNNDASPTIGNSSFSNIQIYDNPTVYNTVNNESSIVLSGNEILQIDTVPDIQGVDHCFVFAVKTKYANQTLIKRGDVSGEAYEISIDENGDLKVTYISSGVEYSLTTVYQVDDNLTHEICVYTDFTNKTVYVFFDGESTSSVLAQLPSTEPTGSLFLAGHDGSGTDQYVVPSIFAGEINFFRIKTGLTSIVEALALRRRIDAETPPLGVSIREGESPILFTQGTVPIDSYGTIIMAVKMPSSLTSKITALSGIDPGLNKINLRASSSNFLSFERVLDAEYTSAHAVSANETLVLAFTSVSGENFMHITKNLNGRQSIATAGDYKLPTEVVGLKGPFELIRIVGYSNPLTEVQERYLIRQIMKHPSVGLL